MIEPLLLVLLGIITALLLLVCSLCLLSPDTTRTSTTKWRAKSEVDMLLGIETNDERRNVDNLLANADVSLADQDTGVVNRLSKAEFVDASLQTALQEILHLQSQHVIELHSGLVEDTDTHKTANEGIAFEETLGILLVEGEKLTEYGD